MSDTLLYTDESTAAGLSDYLRTGTDDTLHRRRRVVGLALISTACMAMVGAMQSGVIHIPPPKNRWLNGSIPNNSPQAYRAGSVPDGLLGLVSYGVTAVLAAMGGRARAAAHPLVPLALAGKVAVDAAYAAKLTVDQATKYKAFCLFCLTATAATLATVPLVLPEARDAVAALTNRRRPAASVGGRLRNLIHA